MSFTDQQKADYVAGKAVKLEKVEHAIKSRTDDVAGSYTHLLGRVVDLVDRETGEIIPSFVSIDRKTNEITEVPANKEMCIRDSLNSSLNLR